MVFNRLHQQDSDLEHRMYNLLHKIIDHASSPYIVLSMILIGILLSQNRPVQADGKYLYANCTYYGIGYFNIPDSKWCLTLGGEVRSRYHIISNSEAKLNGQFDARGGIIIDARMQSELGPIQTHIKFFGDSNEKVKLDSGYVRFGNFLGGKVNSHGNLTYGAYALNANHSLYHADNSTALFGYTFKLGSLANLLVSLEDLSSEMPYINFDLGTKVAMNRSWGTLAIASGVLIHYLEEGGFNKEHPTYLELSPTELATAGEPEELGTFGLYLGTGGEFPIPGITATKFGGTGFYYRGGASKLGLPKQKLATRFESGDNAGRPMDKMGDPISWENFATSAPSQFERFKDFTLVPTEDPNDAPYLQQQYIPWGIAVNGGFSHELNSSWRLNLNGGFYTTFDYDYSTSSYMIGTSIDFELLENFVFSVGGEFENSSLKYTGKNDAIAREFIADNEGEIEPSFSTTIAISSTF